MKLILKDSLKVIALGLILTTFYYLVQQNKDRLTSNQYNFWTEAIFVTPFYLFIALAYYAIFKVCYNIMFINDCHKEYDELILELKNESKKLPTK